MANSSARLPAVEPFDLNDPTPTSAAMGGFDPNLETELLTDLEAGAARVAEPVPLSSPEDASAGRLKFRSPQPQETSKWNSLDPQLVARRLAQLRRPQARAEAPPAEVRPAATHPASVRRPEANATPQRLQPVSRGVPRGQTSPADVPRIDQARPRPNLQRVDARPRPAAPPAAARPSPVAARVSDPARISDGLETALRDLIAEAAAHHRERQRPNRRMVTVAVLLIVGAGLGAMLALQSGSPRGDQAIAATSIPTTSPGAVTAPISQTTAAVKPAAPVQTAAVTPASSAVTDRGAAAVTGGAPATIDPKAATEPARTAPAATQPAAAAAAPHPAWLVEDDPVTFQDRAANQRPNGAAGNPPPSWFVEDDAATFDSTHAAPVATAAAANARRMVVTADVDVRTAPDAKSDSIGVLKAGAAISVGECTLWCAVSVNAKNGWVFYTFLADPALATPAR